MGAVVPVAEPEWSGAHRGLCLYASRVLQAAWDEQVRGLGRGVGRRLATLCCADALLQTRPLHPALARLSFTHRALCFSPLQVVVPMRGSPQLLRSKLSTDTLQVRASALQAGACTGLLWRRCPDSICHSPAANHTPFNPPKQSLEDRLRALDAFLADYLQRRRGRQPGGAADGGAGAAAQPLPAAKRQRLEDAQQAELKRWVGLWVVGWCCSRAACVLHVPHPLGRPANR